MSHTEDAFDGDVSMGDAAAPAVTEQQVEMDPTEDAVLAAIAAKQNVRVVCLFPPPKCSEGSQARGGRESGGRREGESGAGMKEWEGMCANVRDSFQDRRIRLPVLSLRMRTIRWVMR